MSVFILHATNNFNMSTMDADLEFARVKPHLPTLTNIADKNTYLHPAERSIRAVKEQCRHAAQSLPFSDFPMIIAIVIISESIGNLNRFPREGSMTKNLSPLPFVMGAPKLDFNLLTYSLGDHAEVHEENNYQTNSPNARGTRAISLNPVHNSTGSYYFFLFGNWSQTELREMDKAPNAELGNRQSR